MGERLIRVRKSPCFKLRLAFFIVPDSLDHTDYTYCQRNQGDWKPYNTCSHGLILPRFSLKWSFGTPVSVTSTLTIPIWSLRNAGKVSLLPRTNIVSFGVLLIWIAPSNGWREYVFSNPPEGFGRYLIQNNPCLQAKSPGRSRLSLSSPLLVLREVSSPDFGDLGGGGIGLYLPVHLYPGDL